MVNTPPAKEPETPAGSAPDVMDAPVALLTAKVIVIRGLLLQTVCGLVPAPEVSVILPPGVTVIVPPAVTAAQPPAVVMI